MGKSGKLKKTHQETSGTPKRDRSEDEEEISPTLVKDPKQQKMGVSDRDFRELSANVDKILAKLTTVDDKLDVLTNSVKVIEKRVDDVEKQCQELRESGGDENLRAELNELRGKLNTQEQEASTELIVRNLPASVAENQMQLHSIIDKLFSTINVKIDKTNINIAAAQSNDKKSATATLTFQSARIKTDVLFNFRDIRKKFKKDCLFLVSKFAQLQNDDPLNAKEITISNKLTPYFARLLSYARENSSKFEFIYDTPKGSIMMRKDGNFEPVATFEDVYRLIGVKPKERIDKKKQKEPLREKVRTRSATQASISNGS